MIEPRWVAASARELAHGIRDLRIRRGLTQYGLAKAIGTHQSAISRYEDPAYRGWSFKVLLKIAWALRARLRVKFLPVNRLGSQTEEG
jgi:transcriptional regulator with XRE-family HTH domain